MKPSAAVNDFCFVDTLLPAAWPQGEIDTGGSTPTVFAFPIRNEGETP
jgi:hypothetical protein